MRLTFFDPGELRHALHIEAAIETPDGMGGFDVTWTDVALVWAQIQQAKNRVEDFAARKLEEVTHTITIRFRDDVQAGQRFNSTGRIFRILSVNDIDGTRRYLDCKTREERP